MLRNLSFPRHELTKPPFSAQIFFGGYDRFRNENSSPKAKQELIIFGIKFTSIYSNKIEASY